jgi:gas vesicle protein
MAFTKKMFGTGAKKFLFGAGLGAVASLVLGYVAPAWANHPIAKAGEAALSYSVGGVESAIGTAATLLIGPMATRGTRALDNTQTESL